ncbi:MAG: 7-cyano-7-deazaguanine synthase QueC [Gammaproteobacteria bacterium]|nr:7-cyano-7-deazaguanine synthase QueC [Gammaproteobacteria bacterium]
MSAENDPVAALVLLSGGLDSAVTLAVARSRNFHCHALSFDYGQRHRAELEAARRVASALGAASHKFISIDLTQIGGSALTDLRIPVPNQPADGIPVTYVPARNTIFLAFALGYAEIMDVHNIFIGVNAIDYSGYPDCRPEYIAAFERLARLATKAGVEGGELHVQTPLISLSKAGIVRVGADLGVDFSLTVSCYQADLEGRACGRCEACRLRREGFQTAGIADPTRYA